MSKVKILAVATALLASTNAQADVVTAELVDTMPGKAMVGVTGFLLGGFASAGPAGALIGGGLGWILGDEVQSASGSGGRAYRVQKSSGEEVIVRSPGRSWAIGDEVHIKGNRLHAGPSSLAVSSR